MRRVVDRQERRDVLFAVVVIVVVLVVLVVAFSSPCAAPVVGGARACTFKVPHVWLFEAWDREAKSSRFCVWLAPWEI